jgi:hypothetical protein
MADAMAFPTEQTAFSAPTADGQDDVAMADQRNQQIQQVFESNRFQRTMAQGVGKALSQQQAQIAQLAAQRKQQS